MSCSAHRTLNFVISTSWWLPNSTINWEENKKVLISIYKPIGDFPKIINGGLCFYMLCIACGNEPWSGFRMEGDTSTKRTLEPWTPYANVAKMRTQCSKHSTLPWIRAFIPQARIENKEESLAIRNVCPKHKHNELLQTTSILSHPTTLA